jgi:RNA polymerase primary sigma factor
MSQKSIKVDDYEKSTAAYFNLIKNTKPLSKKEEKKLWHSFRVQNDLSARERLINANLKFVPTVAKQFKGCGLPFADIIEEGNVGLIKAIDKFDPKKDNKVISYAIWWIRKCILEAIEKKGVIEADNIDDLFVNINKDNETDDAFNKKTNLTNLNEDNDFTLDVKQILNELFDGISEKEKNIISDYYGLNGDDPKTLDEIGEKLNITKERVRQINEKTLKKMRANALIKKISLHEFAKN